MTKAAAMQHFWESFGIPAYEENSVPPDAKLPYITYQLITDSFGYPVFPTASIWYRGSSNKPINAKTDEISQYIGRGGHFEPYDGGALLILRGNPFAQFMGVPEDSSIKRKYLNLSVEYLSSN